MHIRSIDKLFNPLLDMTIKFVRYANVEAKFINEQSQSGPDVALRRSGIRARAKVHGASLTSDLCHGSLEAKQK